MYFLVTTFFKKRSMKKNLLLVMAVCLLAACSGGGSIGGSKNIFGDLPDKYEEILNENEEECQKMQEKFENKKNTEEDMIELYAFLGILGRKIEEGTAECREKLVGTKLPFEVVDSLPYTVSDITVANVYFEKLVDVVMAAKFTITFKEDFDIVESIYNSAPIYKVYSVVTGDANTMYTLYNKATISHFPCEEIPRKDSFINDICYHIHAGDTLPMEMVIKTDNPDIMRKCQLIRFVDQNEYKQEVKNAEANREAVKNPEGEKEE
jgi:hypothetical protein